MITHLTTTDTFRAEYEENTYVVKKVECWEDGEQKWVVRNIETMDEVEGERFHKIVRLVQNHLLSR